MSESKIYLGVYGILVREGKVLFIKKARGPYIGKYDLPGGGINFGETIADALRREILEEAGTHLKKADFVGINEYRCEYQKEGKMRSFHHIGFYYRVEIKNGDKLKTEADGQDSLGSPFVSTKDITEKNLAPIAYLPLRKVLIGDCEQP